MHLGTRLPFSLRITARLINAAVRLVYGDARLEVNEELLDTMGWRRYVRVIRDTYALVGSMNARYGEADTQFLIGMSAMWNGCGFCSYGHVLTGALLVYRDRGVLHPLHAEVVAELMDMRTERALEALQEILCDYPALYEQILRMYALRAGRFRPETTDDYLLDACHQVWTLYVECTIVLGLTMEPDEAFCPAHTIGRDKRLIARYRRALERERMVSGGGGYTPDLDTTT
ncbi:MAG: hypothetical protein AAGF11_16780 [Myxococcota bacterium]